MNSLKEVPDFLVVSPGGCGSVSLIKYLENFGKSNLYIETKYKTHGLGHIYKPSNFLFKNKIKMDSDNYIVTKSDSTETNVKGVFAAGDVKDKIFRQAVTAAGMG